MQIRKRLLIARNPFKTLLILGSLLVLCHNVHSQSSRILIVQQNKGVRDFSAYIAEILLAEGLVEHELKRLAELSPGDLGKYRVAILPSRSYTSDQLDQIESYVKSGGHLVSFLPQPSLSTRLGLEAGSELTEERKYIYFETSRSEALGIGFREPSDSWSQSPLHCPRNPSLGLVRARTAVQGYCDSRRRSRSRTVRRLCLRSSVEHCPDPPRQSGLGRPGNDAVGGLRPNDMFLRGEDHWIDSAKVMIPQADQQMHFLTSILRSLTEPQTLPRVWYFPAGADAVFILTSDHEFGTASDMEAVRRDMQSLGVPLTIYLTRPTVRVEPRQPTSSINRGNRIRSHLASISRAAPTFCFRIRRKCGQCCRETSGSSERSTDFPFRPPGCTICAGWVGSRRLAYWLKLVSEWTIRTSISFPFTTGYMTGSGLPMRYVDRFGRTADIFQQLTQYEDDVIISQMFYSSNWSTEEALTRFRELLKNSITRFHTAIAINFHPPFYLAPIPNSINSNKAWTHGCIEIAKENGSPHCEWRPVA